MRKAESENFGQNVKNTLAAHLYWLSTPFKQFFRLKRRFLLLGLA